MSFASELHKSASEYSPNKGLSAQLDTVISEYVCELKSQAFYAAGKGKFSLEFKDHDTYDNWMKRRIHAEFDNKALCVEAEKSFNAKLTSELKALGFKNVTVNTFSVKSISYSNFQAKSLFQPKTWTFDVKSIYLSW